MERSLLLNTNKRRPRRRREARHEKKEEKKANKQKKLDEIRRRRKEEEGGGHVLIRSNPLRTQLRMSPRGKQRKSPIASQVHAEPRRPLLYDSILASLGVTAGPKNKSGGGFGCKFESEEAPSGYTIAWTKSE